MEGVSLDENEHKRELYAMSAIRERDYWKNRAEELEEEIKPYQAVCSILMLVYDALYNFFHETYK